MLLVKLSTAFPVQILVQIALVLMWYLEKYHSALNTDTIAVLVLGFVLM